MSAADEDEGSFGFDICSISLAKETDRGPLEMISGERLGRLVAIEAAAMRWARERSAAALAALETVVRGNP